MHRCSKVPSSKQLPPDPPAEAIRAASSHYSPGASPYGQHFPADPKTFSAYTADFTDCSPPISPAVTPTGTIRDNESHRVSPVDESATEKWLPSRPEPLSQIPVMKRSPQEAYRSPPAQSSIKSPTGQYQNTHPSLNLLRPDGGEQLSLGAKIGRSLSRRKDKREKENKQPDTWPPPQHATHAAPWQGASGRSNLVAPIIPANNTSNTTLDGSKHKPLIVPQTHGEGGIYRANHSHGSPSISSTLGQRFDSDMSFNLDPQPTEPKTLVLPKRGESLRGNAPWQFAQRPERVGGEPDFKMGKISLDEQQPSRFSTTTYATTHYGDGETTPTIPDIPVPPIPNESTSNPLPSTTPLNSIKSTTRKPTPSQLSLQNPTSDSLSEPPQPSAPQTPLDRITALSNTLNTLRTRRTNISIILHELTTVIQPSSTAYDTAAREEVKRTVRSLEAELSDVGKEEYEVGMRLHRALRRREREEGVDPEGSGVLWVRRVTK